MRHAADEITRRTGKKMNPDDLQAIIWYAEKHHYEDKGWTRGQGAEKGSFDEAADLAFPKSGKPMTSTELREHYQQMAHRADVIEKAQEYLHHEKPTMQAKLGPYVFLHEITPEELYKEPPPEQEEEAA